MRQCQRKLARAGQGGFVASTHDKTGPIQVLQEVYCNHPLGGYHEYVIHFRFETWRVFYKNAVSTLAMKRSGFGGTALVRCLPQRSARKGSARCAHIRTGSGIWTLFWYCQTNLTFYRLAPNFYESSLALLHK